PCPRPRRDPRRHGAPGCGEVRAERRDRAAAAPRSWEPGPVPKRLDAQAFPLTGSGLPADTPPALLIETGRGTGPTTPGQPAERLALTARRISERCQLRRDAPSPSRGGACTER